MLVRSALHQAGATALTQLLQFPAPAAEQRNVTCPCGHQARYRELRSTTASHSAGPGGTVASLVSVSALP